MSKHFSIRQAFLHLSHPLVREYFNQINAPLDVDWDDLDAKDCDCLLNAWRSLDDSKQVKSEGELQDVWFLGDERGINSLVSIADDMGLRLLDDFESIESPCDRALWTRIHRRPVWDRAQDYLPVDQLANKRMWRHYRDLKTRPIKNPVDRERALAQATGGYFLDLEGHGKRHHAEHTKKPGTGEDYFAVYVDAGVQPSAILASDNSLKKETSRRTATIAFVYSPTAGSVRVYVERDAKVARALFERFHEVMFGEKAPPDDTRQTAYQLSRVLAEDFKPLPPESVLAKSIAITQLRVRPKANFHRQIILKGNVRDNGPNDTFDMIDTLLDQNRMPRHALEVDQMSVRVELMPGRADKRKTLSFDVTWPNGGNLHNAPETLQPIGEKLLAHWGIDTQPKEPLDAWGNLMRLIDAGTTLIGRDEIDKWPNGLTQTLLAEGVLQETSAAMHAVCGFCHESHDVRLEEREVPAKPSDSKELSAPVKQIVYRTYCPDIARTIYIDSQRVQRFEIDPSKLLTCLKHALYIKSSPSKIADGVWRLGMSTLKSIDRPVYFSTMLGRDTAGSGIHPFEPNALVFVPHQAWATAAMTSQGVRFIRLHEVLSYEKEGLIASLDSLFDELSVPRSEREGQIHPWSFKSPASLTAGGETYEFNNLNTQSMKIHSIASGKFSVPLVLLFQRNGTAVWKEKLKQGLGSTTQRRKVSMALSRLNKSLIQADAPLTFELPSRSEEIRIAM